MTLELEVCGVVCLPWIRSHNFQAMDRNIRIDIEAKSNFIASDFEPRHFQH